MPDLGNRANVMGPQPIGPIKQPPPEMMAAIDRFLAGLIGNPDQALAMTDKRARYRVAQIAGAIKPGVYQHMHILGRARVAEHYFVKARLSGSISVFSAHASGKKAWSQEVQAPERARAELTVPPLEDEPAAPPPGPPVDKPAAPPRPSPGGPVLGVQRGVAIGLGALGVVGLVVGTVFGVQAKSQWSDTLAQCRASDPTWCYPGAFSIQKSAASSATASTVSFASATVASGLKP